MLLLYTSEKDYQNNLILREKVLSKIRSLAFTPLLYTKVIHNFLYRPREENYLGSRHLLL